MNEKSYCKISVFNVATIKTVEKHIRIFHEVTSFIWIL